MASPTKQRRLRDVQLSASALPRQDRPHHVLTTVFPTLASQHEIVSEVHGLSLHSLRASHESLLDSRRFTPLMSPSTAPRASMLSRSLDPPKSRHAMDPALHTLLSATQNPLPPLSPSQFAPLQFSAPPTPALDASQHRTLHSSHSEKPIIGPMKVNRSMFPSASAAQLPTRQTPSLRASASTPAIISGQSGAIDDVARAERLVSMLTASASSAAILTTTHGQSSLHKSAQRSTSFSSTADLVSPHARVPMSTNMYTPTASTANLALALPAQPEPSEPSVTRVLEQMQNSSQEARRFLKKTKVLPPQPLNFRKEIPDSESESSEPDEDEESSWMITNSNIQAKPKKTESNDRNKEGKNGRRLVTPLEPVDVAAFLGFTATDRLDSWRPLGPDAYNPYNPAPPPRAFLKSKFRPGFSVSEAPCVWRDDGSAWLLRTSDDKRQWIQQLFDGQERFQSPGVLYSVKLAQSAKATSHLGPCNPLHTMVVCVLLAHFVQDKFAFPTSAQRESAQKLMLEIFRMVYDDFDATQQRLLRIADVEAASPMGSLGASVTGSLPVGAPAKSNKPQSRPSTGSGSAWLQRVGSSLASLASATAQTHKAEQLRHTVELAKQTSSMEVLPSPTSRRTVELIDILIESTPNSTLLQQRSALVSVLEQVLRRRQTMIERVSKSIGHYHQLISRYLPIKVATQLYYFRKWFTYIRDLKKRMSHLKVCQARAALWIPLPRQHSAADVFLAWRQWRSLRVADRTRVELSVAKQRRVDPFIAKLNPNLFHDDESSEFEWSLRCLAWSNGWPIESDQFNSKWGNSDDNGDFLGSNVVQVSTTMEPIPFNIDWAVQSLGSLVSEIAKSLQIETISAHRLVRSQLPTLAFHDPVLPIFMLQLASASLKFTSAVPQAALDYTEPVPVPDPVPVTEGTTPTTDALLRPISAMPSAVALTINTNDQPMVTVSPASSARNHSFVSNFPTSKSPLNWSPLLSAELLSKWQSFLSTHLQDINNTNATMALFHSKSTFVRRIERCLTWQTLFSHFPHVGSAHTYLELYPSLVLNAQALEYVPAPAPSPVKAKTKEKDSKQKVEEKVEPRGLLSHLRFIPFVHELITAHQALQKHNESVQAATQATLSAIQPSDNQFVPTPAPVVPRPESRGPTSSANSFMFSTTSSEPEQPFSSLPAQQPLTLTFADFAKAELSAAASFSQLQPESNSTPLAASNAIDVARPSTANVDSSSTIKPPSFIASSAICMPKICVVPPSLLLLQSPSRPSYFQSDPKSSSPIPAAVTAATDAVLQHTENGRELAAEQWAGAVIALRQQMPKLPPASEIDGRLLHWVNRSLQCWCKQSYFKQSKLDIATVFACSSLRMPPEPPTPTPHLSPSDPSYVPPAPVLPEPTPHLPPTHKKYVPPRPPPPPAPPKPVMASFVDWPPAVFFALLEWLFPATLALLPLKTLHALPIVVQWSLVSACFQLVGLDDGQFFSSTSSYLVSGQSEPIFALCARLYAVAHCMSPILPAPSSKPAESAASPTSAPALHVNTEDDFEPPLVDDVLIEKLDLNALPLAPSQAMLSAHCARLRDIASKLSSIFHAAANMLIAAQSFKTSFDADLACIDVPTESLMSLWQQALLLGPNLFTVQCSVPQADSDIDVAAVTKSGYQDLIHRHNQSEHAHRTPFGALHLVWVAARSAQLMRQFVSRGAGFEVDDAQSHPITPAVPSDTPAATTPVRPVTPVRPTTPAKPSTPSTPVNPKPNMTLPLPPTPSAAQRAADEAMSLLPPIGLNNSAALPRLSNQAMQSLSSWPLLASWVPEHVRLVAETVSEFNAAIALLFRQYSKASTSKAAMSLDVFVRFANDAKLIDVVNRPPQLIASVFRAVVKDNFLDDSAFLHALFLLSLPDRGRSAFEVACQFRRFCIDFVALHTNIQPHPHLQQLAHSDVQSVLKKHYNALRRLFDAMSGGSTVVPFDKIYESCKVGKLYVAPLTPAKLKQICIQSKGINAPAESFCLFDEFVFVFTALTSYHHSNFFASFDSRLHRFLCEQVYPAALGPLKIKNLQAIVDPLINPEAPADTVVQQ